jgi:hypothetical protein
MNLLVFKVYWHSCVRKRWLSRRKEVAPYFGEYPDDPSENESDGEDY